MTQDKLLLSYNLQFFAKEGPGGEKTEAPTSKRLSDARKDGRIAKSQELSAAILLIALFLMLKFLTSYMANSFLDVFRWAYRIMPDIANMSPGGLSLATVAALFREATKKVLFICLPLVAIGLVVSFASGVFQAGWMVTTKPLQPKFDKFNPVNGFKRIFSKESLFNLLKSIVKIALIFYVAYMSIKDNRYDLFILYDISLLQAIGLVGGIIVNTGLKISLIYLIVGVVDYMYQRWKFNDDMKMTKQEVKDEYKDSEGDPAVKGQQKRRMMEASQRRMLAAVPQADVVITNPTHFAIALSYKPSLNLAPMVVAKGQDFVAQRIKDAAKENNVPIVENKPLARMLYTTVDVDQEIPPELYQAVADVLANVFQSKGVDVFNT